MTTAAAQSHRRLASGEDESRIPRREAFLLAGILLLALVLRVVFVLQMRANPYFDDPQLDERLFVDWGGAIARGEGSPPGVFRTAPLYPWFLGLVFHLAGDSLLAARLVQAVLGTAAVLLVHLVARRLFDPIVGLVAAFFAATYWLLIYFDATLVREGPVNVLDLTGILATLAFARRPTPGRSALAGLAWGASALLRQQVLLFVPCLAVWLLVKTRVRLPLVLLFGIAAAAPILPITAYNTFVAGDFVVISAEGGLTLWESNNPDADGVMALSKGARTDVRGHVEDARANAEREEGRKLKASEVSLHYSRKAMRFLREQPGLAARQWLRKAWLVCTDWEFGNPEDPRFFARRFAPIVRWLPLGFAAAFALAVLGLATSVRGSLERFPLWGFLALHCATLVAFVVTARYRMPMIPMLLVYSACGAVWLVRAALASAWWKLAGGLCLAALAYAGTKSYPVPKAAGEAGGLHWLALAESRAGHTDEAVRLFEQSLALFPECDTMTALGVTLFGAGRDAEAVAALERSVDACPQDVLALEALAEMYVRVDRHADAEAIARRAIAISPHLPRSWYALGRACLAQRRPAEAADAFRSALDARPDYFHAAYALGMVSLDLGRDVDAIESLRKAIASGDDAERSFRLTAYRTLVAALARAGHREEAREVGREMIRRFPNDAEARRAFDQL